MSNAARTPNPSSKGESCFPGKIISYSCKVRCMVLVCFLLLASALALIYFLLTKNTAEQESILALPKMVDWFPECPSTLLEITERYDCYPDDQQVTKDACNGRGCCYVGLPNLEADNNKTLERSVPICVYPSNYGYEAIGKADVTLDGFEVPLQRIPAPSRYGDDIQVASIKVEMQTKYRLRIKFYDPENSRYEPPVPKISDQPSAQANGPSSREILLYSITYNTFSAPFAVRVRRTSTDAVIFDTSTGALTLSNQFLEITTKVPSLKVFGFGQYMNGHHKFNWETLQLFAMKIKDGSFSSSVHPFYLCIENDGNAHGVLLLNSNKMEVQLHPSRAITFRTVGGILDFYLFLGPSPEEVIQQYTEAIGRPMIPPYWSLGFHVGFPAFWSTYEFEKALEIFQSKYIPVESLIVNQLAIQKYLSRSKEFQNFSNLTMRLLSKSQKLLIHFSPSIPKSALLKRYEIYNVGPLAEVFVSDKWGLHPLAGKQGPEDVFYPDFGSSAGFTWWSEVVNKVSNNVGIDGFWLASNEPSNDIDGSVNGCLNDNLNNPPYLPTTSKEVLYENTLCMDALMHWREDVFSFYDTHNLYGHSMIMATEQAFYYNSPKKRKLILSDSTFIGSGQFSGQWINVLENSWESLRSSISAIIEQGIYGLALTGANMCGNKSEELNSTKAELCLRWFQLGIFYPFLQVYGDSADYFYSAVESNQEFVQAVRHAISRRYELLPYLYTLFYLAHTNGSAVVRSLFHEFPSDNETYHITSQFMWGPYLLISPILDKGATELNFYLPEGLWYDFYQGSSVHSSGEWFSETGGPFDDTKQPSILHMRAGSIIALQKPGETTFLSRQNSMSLLVALDSSSEANGLLFWDDGETKNSHILGEYILVDFVASGTSFVVTGNFGRKAVMSSFFRAVIQQVRIMGLHKPPKRIVIDSSYILSNKQYYWNYDTKVLDLKHILIPLARRTEVQWFF